MEDYKSQSKDLIFALDIGTRSIVGIVGTPVGDRFKVLDVEQAEHGKRAMMDGQIDDIKQVAALARAVTDRLEERQGVKLERVCVAAAGRALRTQTGSFTMEMEEAQTLDAETIGRLEAGAVSAAEEAIHSEEKNRRQLFLVGYTVAQYRLDNYPMNNLLFHNGRKAEADVVATFLPGEVVESLYATMRTAGLQVSSLTLEPIAAMNAAIPAELRLLNLALVDIGAGTTDIALCRDGSVVGYTMATVAGDEVTEALMQAYLIDFRTAEGIKRQLGENSEIRYRNILGMEETVTAGQVMQVIQEPMDRLADAISKQVREVNGGAPSALFLAGGGSKLTGLREKVAAKLKMDEKRVAIAGNNFALSAFSDDVDLVNPEYTTPLGIAVSAGLGLLNDSYVVMLNGKQAKLFRSGILTLRDILQMNGYGYSEMLGRTGKNLNLVVDGKHLVLRGEPAVPAILRVNDEEATLSTVVHAGDSIHFVPARDGASVSRTLGELLGPSFSGRALVNNAEVPMDTPLNQGDEILTLRRDIPKPAPAAPQPQPQVSPAAAAPAPAAPSAPAPSPTPGIRRGPLHLFLNGEPLELPPKEGDAPYYLMDLLQKSGIDFEKVDSPVRLTVNGTEQGFRCILREGDSVIIRADSQNRTETAG